MTSSLPEMTSVGREICAILSFTLKFMQASMARRLAEGELILKHSFFICAMAPALVEMNSGVTTSLIASSKKAGNPPSPRFPEASPSCPEDQDHCS